MLPSKLMLQLILPIDLHFATQRSLRILAFLSLNAQIWKIIVKYDIIYFSIQKYPNQKQLFKTILSYHKEYRMVVLSLVFLHWITNAAIKTCVTFQKLNIVFQEKWATVIIPCMKAVIVKTDFVKYKALFFKKNLNLKIMFILIKKKLDLKNALNPVGSCVESCDLSESKFCCSSNLCNVPLQCYVGSISRVSKRIKNAFCPKFTDKCQVNKITRFK